MFSGKKLFGLYSFITYRQESNNFWESERRCDLVRPFRLGDAFVDHFAAGKSFFRSVPVRDGLFAHLPAKQDGASFDFAGKIQQADFEILDLDADGIDLGEGIFGALLGLGSLGLAAGERNYIDVRSSVEKDAVSERLHLGLNFFHELLTSNRGTQKRFEHRHQ